MKYYGYIYEGQVANYQIEDTQAFDSPYEALNYANQQWQKTPNVQIPRLLVVKKMIVRKMRMPFFNLHLTMHVLNLKKITQTLFGLILIAKNGMAMQK